MIWWNYMTYRRRLPGRTLRCHIIEQKKWGMSSALEKDMQAWIYRNVKEPRDFQRHFQIVGPDAWIHANHVARVTKCGVFEPGRYRVCQRVGQPSSYYYQPCGYRLHQPSGYPLSGVSFYHIHYEACIHANPVVRCMRCSILDANNVALK